MLNISNHLEDLRDKLAEKIQSSEGKIFDKQIIITQSAGMTAWLKTALARKNGVFANFEFMNQDGFFNLVFKQLFNEANYNNSESLKYLIYDHLESTEFMEKFPGISAYYKNDALRRIQLAAKISDLFDQYQLYRDNMLKSWDNGKLSTDNQAEPWQMHLWRKLDISSRYDTRKKVFEALEENKEDLKIRLSNVSLFGITIFTQFHFDFFKELEKYINVDYYLCLPAKQTEFENELLISFGNKALELMELFNNYDFDLKPNDGNSLLSAIQNQIASNENNHQFENDDSVQIVSCYTPAREAECLYNYLLDLFVKDTELKPEDVLVLATDIETYAPFIKAVFRNAPVKIPFVVSGETNNSEDSIISAIEQILTFTENDLTSEKLISLLEQKRVKQQFMIGNSEYVRSIVRKANIRFGLDNNEEDESWFVSWNTGLEKIILGYAMLSDEEFKNKNRRPVFPFRDAEASSSYDLFRLKVFVEKLGRLVKLQQKSRSMNEWKTFLFEEIVDEMIHFDNFSKADREELSSIYRIMSFTDDLSFEKEVPFKVFLYELKKKLFTSEKQIRVNTGSVCFSSPITMRGIPHKVICFLGLNNKVFPRKDSFTAYDLLGEKYMPGDRSKNENDKYLFLDTLLNARRNLYLSFTGQSVKDNKEIPPSIAIDILSSYIGNDDLIVNHPLHGFSSRYKKNNRDLFTYLYAPSQVDFEPKDPEEGILDEISVDSFVKFFENPIKWYFNNVLDIRYDEIEDVLPETEVFTLDNLEKWKVKTDLLKIEGQETDLFLTKAKKEGHLPLKKLGEIQFNELYNEIGDVRESFLKLKDDKKKRIINIDLDFEFNGTSTAGKVKISGSVDDVFDRKYVYCSLSKNTEKNQVRAYLKNLMLCAQAEIDAAFFVDHNGAINTLQVFDIEQAKSKISELLLYVMKGLLQPLKFSIDAHSNVINKEKVDNVFRLGAEGNQFAQIDPDPYIKNLFDEGYFMEMNVEDFGRAKFDKSTYDRPVFDEIKTIGKLLNLI